MFQPDLFTSIHGRSDGKAAQRLGARQARTPRRAAQDEFQPAEEEHLDLPAVLARLARVSTRPRYTFMVLNLIARAARQSGDAGPYVRDNGRAVPIRDWLSDALLPMARRDARRHAVVEEIRRSLTSQGALPADTTAAEQVIGRQVRERLLRSGRTNVSRAVSDLVRAGLLRRHYQGYRVNHCNRGAQREAVYTIIPAVRRALGEADTRIIPDAKAHAGRDDR